MTESKSQNKTLFIDVFLSFLLSLTVCAFAYAFNGIFPGSSKSIMIYDLESQYVAFYSYLKSLITDNNSFFFQFYSALGGNFFGLWAYYLSSPFNFIILLFDENNLPDALYFLTVIKISFSAISFSVYSVFGRIKCQNHFVIIVSAVSYALMSYNLMYAMSPMWLDGVVMLPFVVLGIDVLLEKNKKSILVVSASIAVVSNYYMSYMIMLFLVIYYVFLVIYNNYRLKTIYLHVISLIKCGLVAFMMTSFIWLPVIYDLKRGKLAMTLDSELSPVDKSFFIRNPLDILRQLLPMSYSGVLTYDAPPVYCGLLVSLAFLFYFVDKKISIRKKIAVLFVFLCFLLSFCVRIFDMVFHGFQVPHMYPARFSFVFSFFLIGIFTEYFPILLLRLKESYKFIRHNILTYVTVLFVFLDLIFNACFLVSSVGSDLVIDGYLNRMNYDYYTVMINSAKSSIGDEKSNISTNMCFCLNDGLLYGYSTLDFFSSSFNNGVSELFRNIGLGTANNRFNDSGLTPLSASLLGVDYYIEFFPGDISGENEYLKDYFIPVINGEDFNIYYNQFSKKLFYGLQNVSIDSFVSYNVFDNLNQLSDDVNGSGDLFKTCYQEVECGYDPEKCIYIKKYKVYAETGQKVFYYIPPLDFVLDNGKCFDELYIDDSIVASYNNLYIREIGAVGDLAGDYFDAVLVSMNPDSEVFFYSFDEDSYVNTFENNECVSIDDIKYNRSGLEADVYSSKDTEVLALLPYEAGYTIYIDGVKSSYESYRNALITFNLSQGEHNILIRFVPPGLIAGIMISGLGLMLLLIIIIIEKQSQRCEKSGK